MMKVEENLQKPGFLVDDFPANGLRGSRGKPGLVPQAIRHFGIPPGYPETDLSGLARLMGNGGLMEINVD